MTPISPGSASIQRNTHARRCAVAAPRDGSMVTIDSDSIAVEKAITRLLDALGKYGARFNDRLAIICRDGELSIRTTANIPPEQVLIGLPAECLLPIEDFQLSLSGNHIRISDHNPAVSPARCEIMERVIDVFNLTDKVSRHQFSTLSSLRRIRPEVYGQLCSGRITQEKQPPVRPSQNDPTIDDLLDTRTLVYRLDPESNRHTLVMMPVMDYCNHHPFAHPYSPAVDPAGRRMLTARTFCPDPITRECFARYGIYDSYDCFLHYGFVDQHTPFVISIPLEIALPSLGTLTIHARPMHSPRTQLPREIADLWFYFPAFEIDKASKSAEVSRLMIPQETAPDALRRILGVILHQIEPALTEGPTAAIIEKIEQQILSANVEFYRNLASYLRDTRFPDHFGPLHSTSEAIVNLQLEKLQRHPFFSDQ